MQNVSDVPGGWYTRRRSSESYELKVVCRRFVQVFESSRAVGFSQNPESTQSTLQGHRVSREDTLATTFRYSFSKNWAEEVPVRKYHLRLLIDSR